MGLRSHHCFVADPDFGTKVMACRIPCLCTSCKARFDLPTKEDRYKNPHKDCDFWEMYKIDENNGWNDWEQIIFQISDECDKDQFIDSQLEALGGITKRMSEVARKADPGAIGAYLCNGECHIKYHLIRWTGEPYQVPADEEIMQDGQTFHVCEGEWLCKGTWLYSVPEACNWYFIKQDDI